MARFRSVAMTILALCLLSGKLCALPPKDPVTYVAIAEGIASSSTVTSSAPAVTRTVRVGDGSNAFQPDVVHVKVGDVVEFQFFPPNHSVVQSDFLKPCIPYEDMRTGKSGFFSGFFPVAASQKDPPKWILRVNDTDPIFYYCAAPGSCVDFQMVGVINPNMDDMITVQRAAAAASPFALQPGESPPAKVSSPSSTSTPIPAPSSSNTTFTIVNAATPKTRLSGSGMTIEAIAGAAAGSVIIALFIVGSAYLVNRKTWLKRPFRTKQGSRGYFRMGALLAPTPLMFPPPASLRRENLAELPRQGVMERTGHSVSGDSLPKSPRAVSPEAVCLRKLPSFAASPGAASLSRVHGQGIRSFRNLPLRPLSTISEYGASQYAPIPTLIDPVPTRNMASDQKRQLAPTSPSTIVPVYELPAPTTGD